MLAHPLVNQVTNQAAAWMLTYLLHSTLLLGLAWLVSKPLARWSVGAEEVVWKLALVGALLTASLQLAAGWQPLAGQWRLADAGTPAVNAGAESIPAPRLESRTMNMGIEARQTLPAALPVAAPAARTIPSLPSLALGAWAVGASLLLAWLGLSYLRLSRRLRSRPRVVGGDLHAQLGTLAGEAGLGTPVRLSCSSRVPVPVALGFGEPEICVPPRALAGLTDEQQEGMLAHELAHLARRDPFWLLLGQALSCVLFFQPLNWVARRRLREISEMLSDEWAVARTGRPLSLAGCLAEVAGWSVGARRLSLPVPGMADRPSSLGRRIRRLLDETRSPEKPARRAWLAAAMGILVIAVAAAAPAISAAHPEPPPAKSAAPTAPAIDVKDATDTPTHPEVAAAIAEATGSERHRGSQHDHDSHAAKDRDDEDSPEVNVEVNVDPEEINDRVRDSLRVALEVLDVQLKDLSEHGELTAEQQEKLSRELERSNRDIERKLRPRLDKLSHDLAGKASRQAMTPEMQRLVQEMTQLGEQMRPSEEEMARLHSLIDEEVRQHGSEGKLTAEERERIRHQAKEMAERIKPTEEQRHRMEQLRKQLDEERSRIGERFQAENREEIERTQKEVHEEVEREMQGVREELRRALEERKAIERQERRDHKQRHDARPKHDPDHQDGDGGHDGSPNPRVSLRMDRNLKCDVRVGVEGSSGR
jgi:beta-lactamase regulating signal transducer with metallopeptidase domain